VPRLLLGTTNSAKVREYQRLLGDLPIELVLPTDPPTVAETGLTFAENALIKGRAYAAWSGLPSLADDGGIEIDALDGEPGVHSARWLGRAASDEELIAYALERLRGVPTARRGAQMRAVCALVLPGGDETLGEGVMRGVLRESAVPFEPGFPYRALFVASAADPFRHRQEALVPIRLRILTDLIRCANS
jgi:XTP/dITP diphosphohydrolase